MAHDDPQYFCHKCGKEVLMEVKATRFDVCDFCGADLRCCLNCRFHDVSYPNECQEIGTAFIRERDKGNFCGSFEFAKGNEHVKGSIKKDEIKNQLDALFKK